MALPQLKIDATEARIAALELPQGGWADGARRDALEREKGDSGGEDKESGGGSGAGEAEETDEAVGAAE